MLHYSGVSPDHVLLYESALRSEIPTLMAGNLGIPQPMSLLLCQQPLLTDVVTRGKVATKLCYGLEKAVKEVGGMEAIMYLVAKVLSSVWSSNKFDRKAIANTDCLQALSNEFLKDCFKLLISDSHLFTLCAVCSLQTVEDNNYDNHENDKREEWQQSKALQLLFSLVNFSPDLSNDYMIANGNKLLSKVLTTSRGSVGYNTLKVIHFSCLP